MALIGGPLVAAPMPRGLRYGILAAATGPLELPSPSGLGGGVQYQPVSCGFARLYPIECDTDPPTKVFDGIDPLTEADPFVVYSTLQCGPVGYTLPELEAMARQRLTNGEQAVAEQAMATILAASATPTPAPDNTSIVSVVAALEQWLYGNMNYGREGYLHAPLRSAAYMAAEGLLVRDGPLWRTNLGTVVIFGDYPDTGVHYISGQATVWRSTDITVPPLEQTLNRATNQAYVIAEREYAVAFDCLAGSTDFDPAGFAS